MKGSLSEIYNENFDFESLASIAAVVADVDVADYCSLACSCTFEADAWAAVYSPPTGSRCPGGGVDDGVDVNDDGDGSNNCSQGTDAELASVVVDSAGIGLGIANCTHLLLLN